LGGSHTRLDLKVQGGDFEVMVKGKGLSQIENAEKGSVMKDGIERAF